MTIELSSSLSLTFHSLEVAIINLIIIELCFQGTLVKLFQGTERERERVVLASKEEPIFSFNLISIQ